MKKEKEDLLTEKFKQKQ